MSIKFQAKHKSGFTVDSPLTPFNFPAGEAHTKVAENYNPEDYKYHIADIRGYSAQDFFQLAMWSDVIRDPQGKRYLLLPYLPGARADRGAPFGAKVYADFINSLNLDKVITLDPHSKVMPSLLRNLDVFPVERIIRREIQDAASDSKDQPYVGVIAPDKGARDRAAAAADVMGVPVYTAGKTRNFETGKLEGFHMEDKLPTEGKFLIVDDICDGGGTFVGLAAAIHETNPDVVLDLWVTHGVFSKGWNEVIGNENPLERINHIHTTNSYYVSSGIESNFVTVHDVTPYLYNEVTNV